MKRRQFLLMFGGALLAGGGLVGGGFVGRDTSGRFCMARPLVKVPASIKIIIADLPANEVCALKSVVPLYGGFGMVEVKGYLVPVEEWTDFTAS
jgi:hypothetical protein